MSRSVNLLPEHPIVETRYCGAVSPESLALLVRETIMICRAKGVTRLLADCSELEGGHSVVDLYATVETFLANDPGGTVREAVLLPMGHAAFEAVRFWENACRNRGLCVQLFDDRERAIAWLME
ncbi:MAG: hypothetical protein IPH09_15845 [bacterium]|nr:hypothetical protein [bacterium]